MRIAEEQERIIKLESLKSLELLVESFLDEKYKMKTFSLWRFELFESIDLREREKKINRILGNIFDWEIHIFDRVVELYRLGSEVHWRWRGENVWKKILLTKKIMN